jgi:UDP-N-acetylglucosamine:LPS N-acetylglucosamine transferase
MGHSRESVMKGRAGRALPRVMAVSSGGGHWVQLRRIMPAFAGLDVFFVSTEPLGDADIGAYRYYRVRNATRRTGFGLMVSGWQTLWILSRERPDVVVTTGAAPGLIALTLAKLLLGSRTVWIDSLAQSESMTLSGRLARPVADAWLVQWAHLAQPGGPYFWGAVL